MPRRGGESTVASMMRSLVRRAILASVCATPLAFAPLLAADPAGVAVRVRPPAAVAEAVPAPPAPGYVWVPGHWVWNGAQYVWQPGTYIVAAYPGAVWVPGRWVERGGGWVWHAGHWRR